MEIYSSNNINTSYIMNDFLSSAVKKIELLMLYYAQVGCYCMNTHICPCHASDAYWAKPPSTLKFSIFNIYICPVLRWDSDKIYSTEVEKMRKSVHLLQWKWKIAPFWNNKILQIALFSCVQIFTFLHFIYFSATLNSLFWK